MELRHLQYFVAVAETLNFSRAAERLCMAQPPLSQQIQRLEEEVGAQLFYRTKRSVRLTEAGQIFLQEAYRTLAQAEHAIQTARRAGKGEIGRLAIGFVGSAAYGFLPTVIRTFRERFPEVELTLREITTVEQVQALREDRIQVGFLRLPVSADNIEYEPVQREPFLLVISAKHPLASLPEIPLRALQHEPFIFVPHALAPGLYDQMMSICVQAGFHPRIVQEAIQFHVIISLVAAGLGVTLVPSSIQTFQRADVVYRSLQHVTIQAEIVAVWRRDDLSPVLKSFLQVVREHAHTALSPST